jgi:putative FmdB family regulatory protein
MPLYEYQCEKCGERFEVMQKFSDEPLSVHEKCGGKVDRLISAPALQFKGSGWYITDYAKSGAKPAENGSTTKSDAPAAKSSGSSESSTTAPASTSSSESKSSSSDSK